jgi:hypothetical protein
LVELETDEVTSNEETIIDVGFYTPDELRAGRDQLESWSQLCLDGIERLMV